MSATALLIIDVQNAIDDPSWGDDRNNPDAEENIATLLGIWREKKWPLFHVRHLSREPDSTYRPGQAGCNFKPQVAPRAGERIIDKSTNSAFIGTSLERELRDLSIDRVVITGVVTNNSVETTARMSGNLGFDTYVVSDATAAFGRSDFNGKRHSAEDVHAMSLANLSGEYATILTTREVIARLSNMTM